MSNKYLFSTTHADNSWSSLDVIVFVCFFPDTAGLGKDTEWRGAKSPSAAATVAHKSANDRTNVAVLVIADRF